MVHMLALSPALSPCAKFSCISTTTPICIAAVAAGLSGASAAAAGDIAAKASTSKPASVTGAGPMEGGSKAVTGNYTPAQGKAAHGYSFHVNVSVKLFFMCSLCWVLKSMIGN